jgi:hypothetical protein
MLRTAPPTGLLTPPLTPPLTTPPHYTPHPTPHHPSRPSQVASLHRDSKDRARQQREQQAAYGDQQARANGFERAAQEARAKVEAMAQEAEAAAVQGGTDREVLVECLRQMAAQLASTRAQAESEGAELTALRDEVASSYTPYRAPWLHPNRPVRQAALTPTPEPAPPRTRPSPLSPLSPPLSLIRDVTGATYYRSGSQAAGRLYA